MKIAIVRPKVGFGLGGAENYVAYCALELVRRGHEVTIIADECNLPQVRFRRAPLLGRGSIAKNLTFQALVKRILKEENFDVVYTCSRTHPSDFVRLSDPLHAVWLEVGYRLGSSKWRKIRPRHRVLLWLEREALHQARKGIITNSKLVRRQTLSHYSLPQHKVHVLYNGCDFNKFNLEQRKYREEIRRKLGLLEKKILLFVGHDWRRKGLDLLKKVLKRLPPDCVLLVAGGKVQHSSRKVCYLGPVKNLALLYGAADLLVLPTIYDPFANVVLEALACGLPVVTSPLNGAAELIRPGETGFVVENQPESLLRAISGILADPPDPQACHQSVSHLTWGNHVSHLLSLWETA